MLLNCYVKAEVSVWYKSLFYYFYMCEYMTYDMTLLKCNYIYTFVVLSESLIKTVIIVMDFFQIYLCHSS